VLHHFPPQTTLKDKKRKLMPLPKNFHVQSKGSIKQNNSRNTSNQTQNIEFKKHKETTNLGEW
jgi:hypothetical protein